MFSESCYQSINTAQSSFTPILIFSESYYTSMHVITTTDIKNNEDFLCAPIKQY